jgi:hypothetical protein
MNSTRITRRSRNLRLSTTSCLQRGRLAVEVPDVFPGGRPLGASGILDELARHQRQYGTTSWRARLWVGERMCTMEKGEVAEALDPLFYPDSYRSDEVRVPLDEEATT